MTDPRIVVVNSIVAQDGAPEEDYKTQLILDCSHTTFSRVKTYASGGYTDIPSGSNLRKALDAAFSTPVKPSIVKVGRIKGTAIYAPVGVTSGAEFGLTITVLDGHSLEATDTAIVADTAFEIVTALAALFNGDSDITDHVTVAVSGTGADAVLLITPVSGDDDFTVTNFTGDYTMSSTITESATDAMDEILQYDSDWMFLTSTSHLPSFQSALMAVAETLKEKMYLTSSANEENYADWVITAVPNSNNVCALPRYNSYTQSKAFYHHLADNYIECTAISLFTRLEPGRSSWQHKALAGFPVALVADLSRTLNTAELINLQTRYGATVVNLGGARIGGYEGSGNRMGDGVRIEVRHWSFRAAQKIRQIVTNFFINRDKIGMNDGDINGIKGAIENWLETQVSSLGSTYALDPENPFKVTMPKASEISWDDKVAGTLKGIEIIAYSDASVDSAEANLVVTFNSPEGI